MRVTLSAAVTADNYLNHCGAGRLVISTDDDWEAVLDLRAAQDAILVGAKTLRRDNPSLVLRDERVRAGREEAGLQPDIAKATLTASGQLDAGMRFFTVGQCERYVFVPKGLQTSLASAATVVEAEERVTAKFIVTELEKRGIERLMVEGGAEVLRMFLEEGMADVVRLAVNPAIRLGEYGTARFEFDAQAALAAAGAGVAPVAGAGASAAQAACAREDLGGMQVATYTLHPDTSAEDLKYLQMAVDQGRRCAPSATSYSVGAVVVAGGRVFTGYTHETDPVHHAEQEAIAKAVAAGVGLGGSAIYCSMEPCSARRSCPESCTQLIIRHGLARVVFAMYEPDCFVQCRGALTLREAGIDVRAYPSLKQGVIEANAHIAKKAPTL